MFPVGMRAIVRTIVFSTLCLLPALACKCPPLADVCSETANSDVVFAGTVELVTPSFMGRWNPAPREQIQAINRAHEQYLANRTEARFAALKAAVRAAFPGLPEEDQKRLENAASQSALAKLLGSVLDGSRHIHLRVRALFKKEGDDDKKSDDDDSGDDVKSLDVLTPFGDCGIDFQVGETYLVYADDDEETGILATDACSRTRRLSDAGLDLPYLSFYKDRKTPAGQLRGFTTFDLLYQVHPREPERIGLPAAGVTLALKSAQGERYTTSNEQGAFVFDGLDQGEYSVTAFAAGFPATKKELSGPMPVHLDARGCAEQVLIIPKSKP
jgi:hypothetical protein